MPLVLSGLTQSSLLNPINAAATANATSGTGMWLDVRPYTSEIAVIVNQGVTTGTIAGKLQYAADANGGSAGDITGATYTASTAAGVQICIVDPKKCVGGFLGFVGTITTGPVVVSVVAVGQKQIV